MILLEIVDFLHIFVDGLRKLRKIWFKTCTVPRKKPNSNQKACGFFFIPQALLLTILFFYETIQTAGLFLFNPDSSEDLPGFH